METEMLLAPLPWQALGTEAGVWVAAAVSAVSAVVAAYLAYRGAKHTANASLTVSERQNLLDTAEKLREGLVARVEQLEGSEDRMHGRIGLLEGRIRQLEDENVDLRLRLRTAGVAVDPPRDRRGEGDAT